MRLICEEGAVCNCGIDQQMQETECLSVRKVGQYVLTPTIAIPSKMLHLSFPPVEFISFPLTNTISNVYFQVI